MFKIGSEQQPDHLLASDIVHLLQVEKLELKLQFFYPASFQILGLYFHLWGPKTCSVRPLSRNFSSPKRLIQVDVPAF